MDGLTPMLLAMLALRPGGPPPWYILAFACACAVASLYGFLQGAWPFALVEAIWRAVAVRRWLVPSKA